MSPAEETGDSDGNRLGLGITAGATFGAALGLLYNNAGQGIVIGVVTGMFIVLIFDKWLSEYSPNSDD